MGREPSPAATSGAASLSRRRLAPLVAATLAWMTLAAPAEAYPTCIIFVPTGTTVAAGQGNLAFYNAYYGNLTSTWAGMNVGLLPELPYGGSGLTFPGLEVGVDVIGEPGLGPDIKPIGNVKLGLVKEAGFVPDLAVGLMSWAFTAPDRSLNMGYAALTHTASLGGADLGRGTLGLGQAFPSVPDQFKGTWPLPGGNQSLMFGWEFPAVGPFTMAFDHVGGDSEVSGTCWVLNCELVPGTYASIGYAFGHERTDDPMPDGYFIQTYTNFDLLKAFGPPAKEPVEAALGMKGP